MVEREAVPKDDTSLCALTKARLAESLSVLQYAAPDPTAPQLLAYAVGVRNMVNEHQHEVTVSRDVVEKFYPLLADLILEVRSARNPYRMQPNS